MNRESIPEDVRRFISACISSVPHLEALLLARGEDRAWTASELAARLYIGEMQAAAVLADLCEQGFLSPTEDGSGYLYRPLSPELGLLIERAAVCYTSNLVEVSKLIHSNINRRARLFADAFKLRKDT